MVNQSRNLSILFVAQVILTFVLFLSDSGTGAYIQNDKMLNLQLDSLDRIVLEQPEDKTLVLEKQDGNWVLPDHFGFPVSVEKITRTFGKLFDTKIGWPIATTDAAESRFKVSADQFERKLIFSSAKVSETLYLGTSPGFKKIHARMDGTNTIYGIKFSAYQASTKAREWTDQNFLHLPRDQIEGIELGDVVLRREDGKFTVEGVSDAEMVVEAEVANLLADVSTLGFQEVLGKEDIPSFHLNSPEFGFVIRSRSGERIQYRYGKLDEKDQYVLKPSNSEYFFKVSKYNLESLQDVQRAKLVQEGPVNPVETSTADPTLTD
ncbi:MAG: DUF4340 domain-containing protein [Pseudomonadota bacterium]|nr:DUF4340 domain-containing protein [Pseudomonadota bacterium]